ncbi:DUF2946 family protein [Halomonas sp. WWR20]
MLHHRPVRPCRHPAYLALLAMLLLVAGPAIGQFSAFDRAGHEHHAGQVSSAQSSAESSFSKAVSWHEQCGYCSLFYHCPVLDVALPQVARDPLLAMLAPSAATRSAQGNLTVFPHALTRAPPLARS